MVLLTTSHRQLYKSGDELHVAKFMPQFDGLYSIIATNEQHSTVMLALPKDSSHIPIFHTSKVKPFQENNNTLFPSHALHPPNPINIDGTQEFFVDRIVDEQQRGQRMQYLVRWQGEGLEGDLWLEEGELKDCKALDVWIRKRAGQAEQQERLTITIPPRLTSLSEWGRV